MLETGQKGVFISHIDKAKKFTNVFIIVYYYTWAMSFMNKIFKQLSLTLQTLYCEHYDTIR